MLKKIVFGFLGIIAIVIAFVLFYGNYGNEKLEITFGKNGDAFDYVMSGFTSPGPDFVWTNGNESLIELPLMSVPKNHLLQVSIDVYPFLAKKIKKQNVDVFANDVLVEKIEMDKAGVYKFNLPNSTDLEKIVLKFKIANPKSPKELKLSNDERKLGFALKKLSVTSVDARNPENYNEYKIGNDISFKMGGNSKKYVGSGWSHQEKSFTWTDGKDAYLKMFIKNPQGKNLRLNVLGKGIFGKDEESQKVTVYVNDSELTTWDVKPESNIYSVVLPESVIGTGALNIRFHIHKPFVPNSDSRSLGMSVKNVDISQFFASKIKIKIATWIKNTLLKDVNVDETASAQK